MALPIEEFTNGVHGTLIINRLGALSYIFNGFLTFNGFSFLILCTGGKSKKKKRNSYLSMAYIQVFALFI